VSVFFKVWDLCTKKHKVFFFLLCLGAFGFSLVEMAGVGSVMPFLAVLTKPELIEENAILAWANQFLGTPSQGLFFIYFSILICGLLLLRSGISILMTYVKLKYSNLVYRHFAIRLIRTYLYMPYEFYITNNTSVMLKHVTKEIMGIRSVLNVTVQLITDCLVLVCLLGLLVTIEPVVTIIGGISSILCIGFLSSLTKQRLFFWSKVNENSHSELFKEGKQILDGVKEIKVFGVEEKFTQRYKHHLKSYNLCNLRIGILTQFPAIILESIAYVLFFIVFWVLFYKWGSFSAVIPVMGIFAMAIQRLTPAIKGISNSLSALRSYNANMAVLHEILVKYSDFPNLKPSLKVKSFLKDFNIRKLEYAYPNSKKQELSLHNLTFKKGTSLGIVGRSGAGKTTLLDNLLNLLESQNVDIEVDGKQSGLENNYLFNELFSYIPQHIFVMDDTVAQNITFGDTSKIMNEKKIWEAIKIAQLEEKIKSLPNGIYELVGDKGVRLSGGERQRLGIARAFYQDRPIIILDEATSALDNKTELMFQTAIQSLRHIKTLIIVAHRLSTVRSCTNIIVMKNGKIVDSGTFNDLKDRSPDFQEIALS
jgi:ATP-binding cassette, subfamily B, bacterial PglK